MKPIYLLLVMVLILIGCHPTPQPAGVINTNCVFPPNQSTNELTMTCTITGAIPNIRVDPFASGNPTCGINSWIVSGQTVNVPSTIVYGQNGDDSNARVRVGVTLGPSTHTGSIAKDNFTDHCNTTVGSSFAINTTFSGTHVALVDKGRTPMCVFQSRLSFASFNQSVTVGLAVNVSDVTKKGTQAGLEKRLDAQIAKIVNGLLSPSTQLSDDFLNGGGRCPNDWHPFTGN